MQSDGKKQKTAQNATLIVALITNFCNPFASAAITLAVPHIGKDFHASATELTWIVLTALFVTALLSIPFGRIADIYGRGKILKSGIALFSASAVLNVFAPNMTVFFIFSGIQGVGAAMIFATNIAIVVAAFPSNKRGSVLGISVTSVYLGIAFGPAVGGFVTHQFEWRAVFILIAVMTFTAFIVATIWLPRDDKANNVQKLNIASILLFVVSCGVLFYGLITLTQNLLSYCMFGAGIVLILLFVMHEVRTEGALIKIRMFSGNREFSMSTVAALFNYAAVFAVAYLMSIYLQLVKHYSADMSGLIMMTQPIIQAALSPIAGRLSDKKSPAVIASAGMACCAGALGMFAFLNENTPLVYTICGLALTGIGIAFFSSPNSNVIMGSVSREDYGIASSILSTARVAGQVICMAAITIIINIVIGDVLIEDVAPRAIVQDMHISFIVFAALSVTGIFFSFQRKRNMPAPRAGINESWR